MNATSHIRMIPEWERQSAVWVGWPTLPDEWGDAFHAARGEITIFVRALSAFVNVHIAAGSDEAAASAEIQCGSFARVHKIPLGDIWLRDTGPIIAEVGGAPRALTFRFDGWGGKYAMPGDTKTAKAITGKLKILSISNDFVLEGGAIEVDGAGNLITTRQCLLDGIRNPGWDEASAEAALKTALGVSNVIWLDSGLHNDHTDGHVDNLARFVAPGHVVCQHASGQNDPNAKVFLEIEKTLMAAGLQVSSIPSPGRVEIHGDVVPASHMNFLVTNNAVIMPLFEDDHFRDAATALAELFPGRDIVPLPARVIIEGGGTFHCMTREIPALETHS